MKVKEYKLYKTAKKTARENNLVIAERKSAKETIRMFDFAELEFLAIPDDEKEVIKADALNHVCGAFPDSFYGKQFDDFRYIDGVAKYNCHRVYDQNGKLLYRIFQLVQITHKQCERKSAYDKFLTTKWETDCFWAKPNDIEI